MSCPLLLLHTASVCIYTFSHVWSSAGLQYHILLHPNCALYYLLPSILWYLLIMLCFFLLFSHYCSVNNSVVNSKQPSYLLHLIQLVIIITTAKECVTHAWNYCHSPHCCYQCRWPSNQSSCLRGRSGTADSHDSCPTPCTGWTHRMDAFLRGQNLLSWCRCINLPWLISMMPPSVVHTTLTSWRGHNGKASFAHNCFRQIPQ